ncbi:GNAT family N-acetyltransferase [Lactobacillus sp. ESL0791]|uniref:GNAT family N-acetyltransferase n=1 Tax=Lactobacillus sp. ESL0791 TaxID=2983234 RepID=UPI0023F9A386|nr:GNAT family N-acetyltransferase [Lactobacillus sp. ESL0791]MDF7638667.1 GNAT family N-acetyltransferase [Lactobacillus sp. ESL0791]
MELKQAALTDFTQILAIIKDGTGQLAQSGINQWQGQYPSVAHIKEDIENGHAYLAINEGGQTVGTIAIVETPEEVYEKINGELQRVHNEYVVVHRVAVRSKYAGHGYATQMLRAAIDLVHSEKPGVSSIMIDTHENNKAMQHLIKKIGFEQIASFDGIYHPGELSYAYEYNLK